MLLTFFILRGRLQVTRNAEAAKSTAEANNELNAAKTTLDNFAPVLQTNNATLRVGSHIS